MLSSFVGLSWLQSMLSCHIKVPQWCAKFAYHTFQSTVCHQPDLHKALDIVKRQNARLLPVVTPAVEFNAASVYGRQDDLADFISSHVESGVGNLFTQKLVEQNGMFWVMSKVYTGLVAINMDRLLCRRAQGYHAILTWHASADALPKGIVVGNHIPYDSPSISSSIKIFLPPWHNGCTGLNVQAEQMRWQHGAGMVVVGIGSNFTTAASRPMSLVTYNGQQD